jgi:O-antigen ligase
VPLLLTMMRQRLLEWQWSDYAANRRNRANLLLHIVSVSLFQVGTVILAYAVIRLSGAAAGLAAACMVAAVVAQGGRSDGGGRGLGAAGGGLPVLLEDLPRFCRALRCLWPTGRG